MNLSTSITLLSAALTLTGMARIWSADPAIIYRNDFQAPLGTTYPEWTSPGGYANTANRAGTVAAGRGTQEVAVTQAPNGQRFLGEFGGPAIVTARPYDPEHFVRVDETVSLNLDHLPAHSKVTAAFDLLVLKSWDGDNPNYGPDEFSVGVAGPAGKPERLLFHATFSNNFKTAPYDLSLQSYPTPGSKPQTGSTARNTLGYKFFGDATYRLSLSFDHAGDRLTLNFSSKMFEGKGTADESWGLANVEVAVK